MKRSCVAAVAAFVVFAAPIGAVAQSIEHAPPAPERSGPDHGSFGVLFDFVSATRGVVEQMVETVAVAYQLGAGVGDGPIAFTPQGLKLLARTYGGIWTFWGAMRSGPVSVGDLLAQLEVLTDRVAYVLDNELVPGEPPTEVEEAGTPTPSPTESMEPTPDGTPSPTGSPAVDPTAEPEPVISP